MAWLTFLMAAVTVCIVVVRYVLDEGTIALQESVVYMHGITFMLGIAYALKEGAHVRVDVIYSRLSADAKARIDLVGHLIFLVPTCTAILYFSTNYVARSWHVMEGSPEVGGIPAVFLLKTLIPLMAGTLLLQGLAEVARAIRQLRDFEKP